MKLIIDMASVIQTGLRKGSDDESYVVEHEGKEVRINTAGHAYENVVDYLTGVLDTYNLTPSDMIMVFEGMDTKKRRVMISSAYKAKRGKSAPEYYDEYAKAKNQIKSAFRAVGGLAVTQDYAEGDDTCGYVARMCGEDCIVLSNDVDLTLLAADKTLSGHTIRVLNGGEINKLPENVFEIRHITAYKALVGDASDSVGGVPGFGPAAWLQLMTKYSATGIDEITEALAKNDVETIAGFAKANNCKLLTKIVDNWFAAVTSYQLVRIYHEWVNTRYNPLKFEAGIVAGEEERKKLDYAEWFYDKPDSRLRKFMQMKRLVTADNFDESLALLKQRVRDYPQQPISFDVETTSSDESVDWMTAQGKPDGVDVQGSTLVGFSLTFGAGGNRTFYVSIKHRDTNNITMAQAREMIEAVHSVVKPIHNTYFELSVLYNAKDEDGTLWRDKWKDAGEQGFLPNIEDTLLMSSYVNENARQRNLKALSRDVLGYKQTEFNDMRTFPVDEDGSKPWPGGTVLERVKKELDIVDGVQAYDSKGNPKMRTVKMTVEVLDANGNVETKRKRNPVTGVMEDVPKTKAVPVTYKVVQYRVDELPATVVFDYGADDTICTSAYYNFAKLHMRIDEHYHVYREVEIDAAYMHAKNFADGFPIAMHEIAKQSKQDEATRSNAEESLFSFLAENGWSGTQKPKYSQEITPAEVKEAYAIVTGAAEADDEETEDGEVVEVEKDEVMSSRLRKMSGLISLIRTQDREGAATFAWRLENLVNDGAVDEFNDYVNEFFDGKPRFAYGNKDMSKLLYTVMGLPVRVRNKLTANMRAAGIREGTPKADALALAYAIADCKVEGRTKELEVLKALQLIVMVNTRFSLFYRPYQHFTHWRTGKVHSYHRQCHANTRRASSAEPNMQQLPVHAKIEGQASTFRRTVRPHKKGAVVVSMDFNAQELRSIADDSQDPNMLACYVGDDLKDMHSITAAGIMASKRADILEPLMEKLGDIADLADRRYKAFKLLEELDEKIYGEYRSLGKKVNFTTEYGAMAEKLAATLMITVDEAQMFIDAREAAFAVAAKWKAEVIIKQAHDDGFIRSRMGAKRHLAEMLDSRDRSVSSKAERQAVNFRIQGSCAEQTKLAEGRMWRQGLFNGKFDAVCYGPVHDEVLASVMLEDLPEFLKAMHPLMVAKYSTMEVPVVSSISFGPNLYDQIEIGTEPTDEAIAKGIEKMHERFAEEFA